MAGGCDLLVHSCSVITAVCWFTDRAAHHHTHPVTAQTCCNTHYLNCWRDACCMVEGGLWYVAHQVTCQCIWWYLYVVSNCFHLYLPAERQSMSTLSRQTGVELTNISRRYFNSWSPSFHVLGMHTVQWVLFIILFGANRIKVAVMRPVTPWSKVLLSFLHFIPGHTKVHVWNSNTAAALMPPSSPYLIQFNSVLFVEHHIRILSLQGRRRL